MRPHKATKQELSLILIAFFIFLNLKAHCLAIDEKAYGDAIIVGSIADARTLNPILASDSASAEAAGMMFNGLVKYDKNIHLTGDLAEGWEIEEEGLVIIFHLRKNVFWHDGEPFTARDVEFTYRKLTDPLVKTPYGGDFERVKSLEAIDDYTVKVTYKEPFAPGLTSWGMGILPEHILKDTDINKSAFNRFPVGTGPYKFMNWKSQEKIELESNHEYFEHRPFIDRYIFRVIPDSATLFLELLTQGVDSASLTPLQFVRQTDTGLFRRNYRKFELPSFSYTYLGFNLLNLKFKDKRVRQALNCAVDKEEIINIVLLGRGIVSTGPFVPQSWAYNKKVTPYPHDPRRAQELLKEAGWQDSNNDGWLDKDGLLFEFTIITNQGNEERSKVAQIIQRRLREIGVKVTIRVVEWSVFLTEFIEQRNFEAVLLGWSLGREPDNYDIWHSSKTKPGEFNFVGYSNAEVDELLIKARRTFNQKEREEYYHRIHELIYEDQPYMFLYVADSLSALHNRFQGVEPAPIGIGYNFIDWWVSRSLQRYNTVIEK